jgi:hypothetical protein
VTIPGVVDLRGTRVLGSAKSEPVLRLPSFRILRVPAVVVLTAGLGAPLTISHNPAIECFPVNESVVVRARFRGTPISRAFTYFRCAGTKTWFYDRMQPAGSDSHGNWYETTLPKPLKSCRGIDYYIRGDTKDGTRARTREYHGKVVSNAGECKVPPLVVHPTALPARSPTNPLAAP